VIISIILALKLARNATHMEGDHQMGVKNYCCDNVQLSVLLVIAAQN